jgi:hypothetical protein
VSTIDKPGDWTVLVYMSADNNLEPAALDDLREMTEARGTQFIVLVDRSPGYTDADAIGLGNFTDARVVRILNGKVQTLARVSEPDMGDPAVLSRFVKLGLTRYKRSHNALVVWDHGGGWHGAAWDDTNSSDNLEVPDLAQGITAGLHGTGVSKLDFVGFDACLMADFDVAQQLSGTAHYLLASEEVEPGLGWDWSTVSTPRPMTTVGLATQIVHGFTTAAQAAGIDDTTLSLTDLEKLGPISQALDQLDTALASPEAQAVVGRIASARARSISFGRDPDPKYDYFEVDLGELADGMSRLPDVGTAADALKRALTGAVVTSQNGPVTGSATGLSLYFPPSKGLRDLRYQGAASRLTDAFYSDVAAIPDSELPLYTDKDRLLQSNQVQQNANSIELSANVTPGTGGNIAAARMFWGQVDIKDPDNVMFYGRRNALVSGDQVSGTYDWHYLTVSDGRTKTIAFSDLTFDRNEVLSQISIPIRYLRGTASARGRLVLSMQDGQVAAETFYLSSEPGSKAISAVDPQPGDAFLPLLLRHRLDQPQKAWWIPSTNTPLAASPDGLTFAYTKDPSATAVMLGLSFDDLRGFRDFEYYGTASP